MRKPFENGRALGGFGASEGRHDWMYSDGRKSVAHEVAHGLADHDGGGATVGFIGAALQEVAGFQTIHDAGDGAVGETYAAAKFLEAEAFGVTERLHDAALRAGEASARELGLDGLAQYLPHRAQMAVDLLCHGGQFLFFSHGVFYGTKGIKAPTSRW